MLTEPTLPPAVECDRKPPLVSYRQTLQRRFCFSLGRYQVKDVSRSVAFYTQQLGFRLDRQNLPAFGLVSMGNLKLILSGPGTSGSRPLPDGRT